VAGPFPPRHARQV